MLNADYKVLNGKDIRRIPAEMMEHTYDGRPNTIVVLENKPTITVGFCMYQVQKLYRDHDGVWQCELHPKTKQYGSPHLAIVRCDSIDPDWVNAWISKDEYYEYKLSKTN
jgi:hypothetical protein